MAIIKTYPLKSNYYGSDKFLISDMQPDSEGNVSGDTKNITFSTLKNIISGGSLTLTTQNTSGAATYDANTNTLNVPVYDSTTYTLQALDKSSNSVPLKLDASSGTDSTVNFTEGTNVTLTRNSATEITIAASGGSPQGSNTQFQYNNNGAFAGTSLLVVTGNDEIQIGQQTNEQGKLIVSGQASGTSGLIKIEGKSARGVTFSVQPETNVNYDVIFPDQGPGGNNKILESNSSGELVWITTPSGGGGTIGGSGTANYMPKFSTSTTLANSVIYESSSNIGIGTTAPVEKLEVAGKIKSTVGFVGVASSGYSYMELGGPSGGYIDLKAPNTDDYDLRIISGGSGGSFWTGGFGHIMTLSATGNVGISVTSPAAKLDITNTVDQTGIRVTSNDYNNYLIQKRRTDDTQKLGIKEFGSNGGLALVTGGSERLNINNLGNIGIGTTNPLAALQVNNTSAKVRFLDASDFFYTEYGRDGIDAYSNTNGTAPIFFKTGGVEKIRITSTGSLGIGTASPSEKLDVNGAVNLTNLKISGAQGTNGQALTSTGSGIGWVTPTDTTYTANNGILLAGTNFSNSDRGSTAVAALDFFKTIATPTNDVIASGNDDTLTLAAGGNTGIFINGSGSQVTIGLYAPTVLDRGGIKLVDATQQSVGANGLTTTAGRTYAIQLNASGQAVVNVPWSGGSGGGISFSGSTVGGLATFTNSSTAGVSSKVNLNASGLMDFDYDGNSAGSIDFDPTGTRLKIGDLSSGNSGIVEIFTNGNRQFQIGVNGEIGLGTGGSQGVAGQILTSGGNGAPPSWTTSSSAGSSGTSGVVQLSDGSSGFTSSTNLFWETISGTKGRLVIGKPSNNIDREGILKLLGGPNSAGSSGVGGTIELQAAVGKSGGSPAVTKIQAPVSNSTAQEIILPSALPTATSQVLGVTSLTGSEVVTAWTNASGGGITQTIMPWNATLARADGTSWTEIDAAGQVNSDTMVIQVNNCFATIQGNVVNYQFYISGYFKGNSEADGQHAAITGPLFLARCQNADGSGTVSGIPIEASQSTTVIDNRFANGSLVVTEDPFASKQSSAIPATVGNMGTYWKLPIRGGKVGRAYSGTTTIPGFVQLFTSNAAESTNPGKDYSTCVYPINSTDVWYSNQYEYMPEDKGYNFVFAGTITAFVLQSS